MKNAVFVELLTGAKEYLWDGVGKRPSHGPRKYICSAIQAYAWPHGSAELIVGSDELLDLIQCRTNGQPTLSAWLVAQQCGVTKVDVNDTIVMQAHRLAWIDELIKEFSA